MREHGIGRVALIAAACDPLHIGKAGVAFGKAMRRTLQGAPRLGRILYCSTVHRSGRVSFLGKSSAIYPAPDNDAVEAVLSAHPDKFVGWVFLNPRGTASVEEAERRFRHPGWIGVKAHPFWHRYPVSLLDDVAALCQERDRPMLVHVGAGEKRGDFRHLPERFPRLRIVYAHAGIPWYDPLWADALRRDNVFVDLSSPYLDEKLRHRALRVLGAARCLYGSDGPYGYPARDGRYDHGAILQQIERAGLRSQDLDRVLGGNLMALATV
jgi:predicted TIM-barrel fold metal-dependent hydrolase